jgi:hypothetical protein
LTESFTHEVAIVDGAIKHDVIAIIDFVDQGAIDAEAIHVAWGAGIEATPRVILTLLAIATRDVHVCQCAKRRKIVDVRANIQASLMRSDVLMTRSVVHRCKASIDTLHCMLYGIERE